jgi:RNA polymerase sigma-32 factor
MSPRTKGSRGGKRQDAPLDESTAGTGSATEPSVETEAQAENEGAPEIEAAEPSEAELEAEAGVVDAVDAVIPPAVGSSTTVGRPSSMQALAPLPASRYSRDTLQRYMSEAARYPLLTREEEHDLAVRYREKGDLDAAYRLVAANLRLVVKIAFEYHRTAFSVLDLIQEGNVGLMHAVKKFDPYRGVKLSTYAAWWIRAFILRYVMENWRMVKLGTTQAQRKLFFNLKKEKERLLAQGFDPGPKLLAEKLDVSEQDVIDMDRRLSQDELSLDAPVSDDSKTSHQDRLAHSTTPVDERLADEELADVFHQGLGEFAKTITDEKERYIFEKRLTAEEPLKLQEIGDHFGVSRERARQIEAKLTDRLKRFMRERIPDFKELSFEKED